MEPRSLEAVNADYVNTMAVLGEKCFSINKLQSLVSELQKKGEGLLLEAQSLQLEAAKKNQEATKQ
jgi:hypothetical protein